MRISDGSSDVCSSDLAARLAEPPADDRADDWPLAALDRLHRAAAASPHFAPTERSYQLLPLPAGPVSFEQTRTARSEEHTSELQSLMRISYAVFCLKKKQTKTQTITASITNNPRT